MRKRKREFRYKFVAKYNKKKVVGFARTLTMLKINFSDKVRAEFKEHTLLQFKNSDQISPDWWMGSSVTLSNKRIFWEVFDKVGQASHAGAVLGQIGGSNGTGESKRRGDSNYYNELRKKGLLVRLENARKRKLKEAVKKRS